ncbi:MAG: DUF1320 domain-containing protein [Candidatus Contendobacter sp.]|nr:DUF1320 domain-containing protein [Candidatus Contendobacter sp.]
MTYATLAALEDAYGVDEIRQLADRDADGVADVDVVAAALARADGLIDSYLAGRYAIPITPTLPLIVAVAGDLARYYLYDDAVPERVQKAHDDAVAWLKSAARGDVILIGAAGPETATAQPGPPAYAAPARTFSADSLADFGGYGA